MNIEKAHIMHIKFLKAYNGDCIWLRYKCEEGYKNIIIDGGTRQTYNRKNAKQKLENGDLRKVLDIIVLKQENVDLLVITHVDDDHIGGILKWFENDTRAVAITKEVWFNSSRLISERFETIPICENELEINLRTSPLTSIRQGNSLETILDKAGIWNRELIEQGREFKRDNLVFKILSPDTEALQKLNHKWLNEYPYADTGTSSDYTTSVSALIKADTFIEDTAIHNGSSIAFLLTFGETNMLFLADAHPNVIIAGLRKLGYSEENPLKLEFVKLAHHGSKKNTSLELLNLIKTSRYIVSSNGEKHNLPDKLCLARIISQSVNTEILFNYYDLAHKIFTKEDFQDYKFIITPVDGGLKYDYDGQ